MTADERGLMLLVAIAALVILYGAYRNRPRKHVRVDGAGCLMFILLAFGAGLVIALIALSLRWVFILGN